MNFFRTILFVCLCFCFISCSQVVLLQQLEQGDANQILVLLAKNGIRAKRKPIEKQQEITWMIYVSSSQVEQARELLVAHHLPKKKELGLSGVCKDAGLIPTPKTEKCRELLALKGEIINSFESIPGVVDADVVINIPDKEDFPNENKPEPRPTASVVIQTSDTGDTANVLTESKVQQFVANAVTGMDLRDVAVIISRTKNVLVGDTNEDLVVSPEDNPVQVASDLNGADSFETVGGLKMDSASVKRFRLITTLFLSVFILLSVALIFVLLKLSRVRQQTGGDRSGLPALPERAKMNQLVEETRQAETPNKEG